MEPAMTAILIIWSITKSRMGLQHLLARLIMLTSHYVL